MGRKTDQGGFEIYHHASFVIAKTRINLLGRDFVEGFSKFEDENLSNLKDPTSSIPLYAYSLSLFKGGREFEN